MFSHFGTFADSLCRVIFVRSLSINLSADIYNEHADQQEKCIMRLTPAEVDIIRSTAKIVYKDARIWLFGSRIDDRKKGGDIDLFVDTTGTATLKDKLRFLVLLERKGISRKIDLIIKSPNLENRSIFDTARKTGILL